MPEPVKIAFQRRVIVLPLAEIMPMRSVSASMRQMLKYKRILASIGEVGIVEPLVLAPRIDETEPYMLVDGHLRLAALTELGATTAPCLLAHDDEGFTYNKRVNRLATVQEHYMITKALERGVSEQRLARTLNIDVRQIRLKRSLLVGICPEVIDLLKDRPIDRAVFTALRKMKAMRQIDAVELMMAMNNFTSRYAQALLAATRQEDLARPEQPKKVRGLTPEQMARMEREMEGLQREFKAVEASYERLGAQSRSRLRIFDEDDWQQAAKRALGATLSRDPDGVSGNRRCLVTRRRRTDPSGGAVADAFTSFRRWDAGTRLP
jgi:ParB-like chromosome segregation protein Spo0J